MAGNRENMNKDLLDMIKQRLGNLDDNARAQVIEMIQALQTPIEALKIGPELKEGKDDKINLVEVKRDKLNNLVKSFNTQHPTLKNNLKVLLAEVNTTIKGDYLNTKSKKDNVKVDDTVNRVLKK